MGTELENKKLTTGHLSALFTIIIWATTYISTKVLLTGFQPVEILFFRFLIGLGILLVIYPKKMPATTKKQELTFALAGLCGICLYYLLENIALNYTMASNVGVIISVAPFFTAILTHFFAKNGEKLKSHFFVGFVIAMAGVFLISYQGMQFQMNPLGDALALGAAFVWACYAVLTKKIAGFGLHTIQTTRRTFAYGIIFMIPTLFFFPFEFSLERFSNSTYLFNILFLGIGASALCFVTWNYAVKILGAIKTSIYIYLVPAITVATSVVILDERITPVSLAGIALTLAGLFLSGSKLRFQKARVRAEE